MQPDIRCERSNRVFAMGRVMTKAQVVAASWLRDSSLSVVARPPSRIFCQQGRHLLQSGPIAPFSATTPLFGRNGRFGGARRRCACSSPAVCLTLRYVPLAVCRSLPISQFCQSSSAVCRLAPGACHSVWPLPSAPGLSALSLAARRFPLVLAPFCPRSAFLRLLRAFAIPPIAVCRTSAAPLRR